MKIRHVITKLLILMVIIVVMAIVNLKIDRELSIQDEFDSKELSEELTTVWSKVRELKSKVALDDYLSFREATDEVALQVRGSKIKSGQAKHIVWNGPLKTPYSIVYIHGFSAGPLEIQPALGDIGNHLHANVFATRLRAHGLKLATGESDGEELARVRARDWVVDVEEALAIGEQIGERVIVIAMSTGVPLVLESLDRRHRLKDAKLPPLNLASVVLLSPNYDIPAFGSSLLEGRFGSFFAKHFVGEYYEFKTENEFHRERWTSRYRTEALPAMMAAVRNSDRFDLRKVTVPVMTIYTSKDTVVSVKQIEARSNQFGGPYLLVDWPLTSFHQLSSAAFIPERSPEFVALILKGIKQFDIGTRELEDKSSKGL